MDEDLTDEDALILHPNTDQAGIVRRNVRLILIGAPEDVEGEIIRSHLLRHSHVHDWSRPLRLQAGRQIIIQNPHEVMRIWKRYIT